MNRRPENAPVCGNDAFRFGFAKLQSKRQVCGRSEFYGVSTEAPFLAYSRELAQSRTHEGASGEEKTADRSTENT